MRTVVYARVSTTDQTCEQQLTAAREYCTARKWRIAHEYVDTGFSGSKTDRPALKQLMTAADGRKIDAVIVWKLDRFGRSLSHLIELIRKLDALGVRFIALTQGIDTDVSNPTARLLLHILGAMAEFERELIRERTVAGVQRAKAAGVTLGRKRAEINMQKVRDMHAADASLADIGRATGVSKSTVSRILRREKEETHATD